MKLEIVLGPYWDNKWTAFASKHVSSITSDSRSVNSSSIFIAVSGYQKDGHDFLPDACNKNPIAIVVENTQKIPSSFTNPVIQVQNSRKALSTLSHHFYSKPSEKFIGIGVTGTNGKSTVVGLVEHIITSQGQSCGVMGTLGHHLGTHQWESHLTTSDPTKIHKRLNAFLNEGANYFCMEVSSHAITQHRISDVKFKVCAFTNLSRDHLDYHKNMETYFHSKAQLFHAQPPNTDFVINSDCPWGQKLAQQVKENKIVTVGQAESNDFSYKILNASFKETVVEMKYKNKSYQFPINMIGEYNVQNSVIALAISQCLGLSLEKSILSLKNFKGVTGRLENVSPKNKVLGKDENMSSKKNLKDAQGRLETNNGPHVFIDYAHTPSALLNVLRSLQHVNKKQEGKLYVVFGCGGDRDFGKRSQMGCIAVENANVVIVTSDNPRTEDPQKIIHDILKDIDKDKVQVVIEEDRKKAIEWALQNAGQKDIVLVAGKGHETYQIIGNSRIPFSDRTVIEDLLSE